MAQDVTDNMIYFLSVQATDKDYLGTIRHWTNLKTGFEEDKIWVKDFTIAQIESQQVKSIPYKDIYYTRGGKLFKKGSLLPERNIPALLWTPIQRGLPLELPDFNHNFFGISQQVPVSLIESAQEQESFAMLTSLEVLKQYIETAPAVRLQPLAWAILNHESAVILGTPLLPLQGEVFWKKKDFLMPAGYDFELFALTDILREKINPEGMNWVMWNKEGQYCLLNKKAFQDLSLSSLRKSNV
jgi:hypothetical protein